MKDLIDSISRYGILTPLVVRPLPEGVYEIISGHRRKHAAEQLYQFFPKEQTASHIKLEILEILKLWKAQSQVDAGQKPAKTKRGSGYLNTSETTVLSS